MASLLVAGVAASLLSRELNIQNKARNRVRSDAIRNLLTKNCIQRGFSMIYEEYDMPDLSAISRRGV